MNEDKPKLFRILWFPVLFVSTICCIKLLEISLHYSISRWGILPQTIDGLKGILAAPLIHSDFEHVFSNSIPLLVLSSALFYFYNEIRFRVFFLIYFIHGIWLWSFGRESYHIGASGLVYGLAAFIFFSGVLRRNLNLMALSLLTIFLYGSFVWGVLPYYLPEPNISWESHLSGAMAGIILAWFYRTEGPQRKVFEWEQNDDNDDEIEFIEEEEEENK